MHTSGSRLTPPRGFHFDRTVRSHGWFDLPPFSYDREARRLQLAFELDEEVVEADVTASGRGLALHLACRRPLDADGLRRAHIVLGSVLRLEEDLTPAGDLFAAAPRLDEALRQGGGRLLRAPTVFEDAVKMICTVNCSWSLTRTMVGNMVEAAGVAGPSGRRAFPSPATLASRPERFFRDVVRAGYRAPFLRALAVRVASGELDLEELRQPGIATPEAEARLRSIAGFGPYATDSLLRMLGRYDRLGIDAWCRRTFRRLYPRARGPVDRAIERTYRRFAPYQGLAMWLDLTAHWHEGDTWP